MHNMQFSIIKETAATKNLNISENITQNYQETQWLP